VKQRPTTEKRQVDVKQMLAMVAAMRYPENRSSFGSEENQREYRSLKHIYSLPYQQTAVKWVNGKENVSRLPPRPQALFQLRVETSAPDLTNHINHLIARVKTLRATSSK